MYMISTTNWNSKFTTINDPCGYFKSKQIKEETKRGFEYFVKPNDFLRNTI